MNAPVNIQKIPTGLLLQDYREVLQALGAARAKSQPLDALGARSYILEEEISRRIAW